MSKLEYKTNKNHLNSLLLSEETLPVNVTANKVDLPKLCRTCLCNANTNDMNNKTLCVITGNGKMLPIYQLFETATGSKFDFNSKMPHHLCCACLKLLNNSYTIRTQSQRAEGIIQCIIVAANEVATTRNYAVMKTNAIAAGKPQNTENLEIKIEMNDRMEQDGAYLSNERAVSELKRSETMSTSEGTDEDIFIISVDDDDEEGSDSDASLKEQSTSSQDLIECTFCKKAFSEQRELILHYKNCKANVKTVRIQSDEFPSPTSRFRKPGKLKQTIQRCTKLQNQKRKDLRKAMAKSPNAAEAMRSRKQVYHCPNCEQKFNESTKLKEHMLTHTQNDINKFYHCMQCVKQWTTQQGWLLHMDQHEIEADKQERQISK